MYVTDDYQCSKDNRRLEISLKRQRPVDKILTWTNILSQLTHKVAISSIPVAIVTGITSHLCRFPYNNFSIAMKPYIKGKYWVITTMPLDDDYFLLVIIQLE